VAKQQAKNAQSWRQGPKWPQRERERERERESRGCVWKFGEESMSLNKCKRPQCKIVTTHSKMENPGLKNIKFFLKIIFISPQFCDVCSWSGDHP
jgi:hypothetical protein